MRGLVMARTVEHAVEATGRPHTPRAVDSARAWLVVVAASVATFTVFGVAYSFGGFFSAMSEDFGTGKGKTTLLFGIANFVYFTGGFFTGRLCDRIGPRPLIAAAAVALFGGLMAT